MHGFELNVYLAFSVVGIDIAYLQFVLSLQPKKVKRKNLQVSFFIYSDASFLICSLSWNNGWLHFSTLRLANVCLVQLQLHQHEWRKNADRRGQVNSSEKKEMKILFKPSQVKRRLMMLILFFWWRKGIYTKLIFGVGMPARIFFQHYPFHSLLLGGLNIFFLLIS